MTIIGVFSSKGGVGKTFLATNLAAHLSINHKQKVLLLDLGGDYTNSAIIFKVIPRIVRPLWKGIVITEFFHYKLYDYRLFDEKDLQILDDLNKIYDFIIIDFPPTLSNEILNILKKAGKVLLVTTPTFLSLYSNLLSYKILRNNGIEPEIVVNMYDGKRFSISDISSLFDKNILSVIPFDHKIKEAESYGIPYIFYKKADRISREIYQLSYAITGKRYTPNTLLYKIRQILAI